MGFVLEESELLEDTIVDKNIRNLYCQLHDYEKSGDFRSLIEELCSEDSLLYKFINSLLKKYKIDSDASILNEIPPEQLNFSAEDKESVIEDLGSPVDGDAAALALTSSAILLELFVVHNFLVPTKSLSENLYPNPPSMIKCLQTQVHSNSLAINSSIIYDGLSGHYLLKLSILSWDYLKSAFHPRQLMHLEFLVWKHRLLTVYLSILVEPQENILRELRRIEEFIFDHHILNDVKSNNTQLFRFNTISICCELTQSALMRGSLNMCRKFLNFALESAGIKIEHTGLLGRRTKFQQKDVSLLVIKVTKQPSEVQLTRAVKDPGLPEDLTLEDDTLLPDISFTTQDPHETGDEDELSIESQLLLMNDFDVMITSEAMEESLKDEYSMAYLRSIIKHSTIWALRQKALALRSITEKKHYRRSDRALRQLESLIHNSKFSEAGTDIPMKRRNWFYAVMPPSVVQVRRYLADVSSELGLYKNALMEYESIGHWDGVIKCCCAIGQTHQAESMIMKRLREKPTPYLYCMLGDIRDSVQDYEKAWDLSEGKLARAKKSIGTYFYVRKDYLKAVQNYELAHRASPSDISILSLLAYSYLLLERYDKAAECYRNITYFDDSNFLVWNNLSKAYINLGQKDRAWRTLREAIRCSYDEWKVWDNFKAVSLDLGAVDDAVIAINRIIDLKKKYTDDGSMVELSNLILSQPSTPDFSLEKAITSTQKLIARLISTSDCDHKTWVCYFKLQAKEYEIIIQKEEKESQSQMVTRIKKMMTALQRATPVTNTSSLEIDLKAINYNIRCYEEVLDCFSRALDLLGLCNELKSRWTSFKLTLRNAFKGYKSKLDGPELAVGQSK